MDRWMAMGRAGPGFRETRLVLLPAFLPSASTCFFLMVRGRVPGNMQALFSGGAPGRSRLFPLCCTHTIDRWVQMQHVRNIPSVIGIPGLQWII
jgi:hypothetical protein